MQVPEYQTFVAVWNSALGRKLSELAQDGWSLRNCSMFTGEKEDNTGTIITTAYASVLMERVIDMPEQPRRNPMVGGILMKS